MSTTKSNKVIGYVRVSTAEQVEGNSLVTQEETIRAYADREGFVMEKIFIEKGESAKTLNRTVLREVVEYCRINKGKINAIIIYKVDRLSRNTADYAQLRYHFLKQEVRIISATESFDDTPAGKFMESTLANVAQFDNDMKMERIGTGMSAGAREGRWIWPSPIGYRNKKIVPKSNIEIDPIIGPLVAEAFALLATGIYPASEVRKMLIARGLNTKRGKPISKSAFIDMLKNPIYTGLMRVKGELYKGDFPALIETELYDRVQSIMSGNRQRIQKYTKQNPDFPLRGSVICEECGKKMTAGWHKGRNERYPYYICHRCPKKNVLKDSLENLFIAELQKIEFTKQLTKALNTTLTLNYKNKHELRSKTREQIIREIASTKEKQEKIVQKNIAGVIPDDLAASELKKLQLLLGKLNEGIPNEINEDLPSLLEYSEQYLEHITEYWINGSLDLRQRLQRFVFPDGLIYGFNTKKFGTTKTANVFKLKQTFLKEKSVLVGQFVEEIELFGRGFYLVPLRNTSFNRHQQGTTEWFPFAPKSS